MRPIKVTPEAQKSAIKKFTQYLKENRAADGKIDFRMNLADLMLPQKKVKPLITITPLAYCKMMALVRSFDKELAWRGTVERLDEYNFRITDIYCYPQKVTAVTVESNDDKYPLWLNELEDDVYNSLHFQGHSHVNMGANPSGVDTNNWEDFLQTIADDGFMIFCIANKREDFYWTLYDLKTNVIFEPKDLEVAIELTPEYTITAWAEDNIDEHIQKPAVVVNTVTGFRAQDANALNGGLRQENIYYGKGFTPQASTHSWEARANESARRSAIAELMRGDGREHY